MTAPRFRRAASSLAAVTLAAACVPLLASTAAAVPPPVPVSALSSVSSMSSVSSVTAVTPSPSPTPSGAPEGTADTQGAECRGVQDPQVRVFGITAASTVPGTQTIAPDQRTRFSYTNLPVGAVVRDYVGVVNKSCFPVTLSIYAADAYNSPKDGSLNILESGKVSKDLGSWVQIGGGPTITVAARSTAIRQFLLKVPLGATPGDHVAAIIASTKSAPPKSTAGVPISRVSTEYRVGARLQVRVSGALRPGLTIAGLRSDYSQGGNPFWGGSARVTYTVRNTGNITVAAPQQVQVRGLLNGTTAIPGVPKVEELLPGNEVTYTAVAPNLFPLDLDTASVTVQPTDIQDKPVAGLTTQSVQSGFVALSWMLVAIILALLAGIGFYFWRRHRGGRTRPPAPPSFGDETGVEDELQIVNFADAGRLHGRAQRVRERPLTRRPAVRWAAAAGSALAVALGMAVGPALAGGSPAMADDAGTLTFIPATGQDVTPMWMVSSGPCPTQTKTIMGLLNGGSFPADTLALGATTAGFSTSIPFGVGVGDSFLSLAVENNVKIVPGDYTIRLLCLDHLQKTIYKEFDGKVTFSDATHYSAVAPSQPPGQGVPLGILSYAYPKNEQVQAAAVAEGLTPPKGAVTPTPAVAGSPAAAGSPGVPGVAGSPAPGSSAALGGNDTNTPLSATPSSAHVAADDGGGTWIVVGVGAVVIGSLVGLRVVAARQGRPSSLGGALHDQEEHDDAELQHAWPDGDGE